MGTDTCLASLLPSLPLPTCLVASVKSLLGLERRRRRKDGGGCNHVLRWVGRRRFFILQTTLISGAVPSLFARAFFETLRQHEGRYKENKLKQTSTIIIQSLWTSSSLQGQAPPTQECDKHRLLNIIHRRRARTTAAMLAFLHLCLLGHGMTG